jgi:hypothetical protein
MPAAKRDHDQGQRALQLDFLNTPTYLEVAQQADTEKRLEALRLADAATHDEWLAGVIDRYRDIVNFNYWRLHCEVEQTPDALAARKAIYDGEHAFHASDLDVAKKQYDEGLAKWRAVLDAYPQLLKETIVIDELADVITEYSKLLYQLDIEELPKDFVLRDVIEAKNNPNRAASSEPPTQTPGIDVTGPSAESDRGTKKPAPETEVEPPAPKP